MRIIAVIKNDKGKDTTWDFVPRNIWSIVETNIGIICACLPVLKTPILRGLSTLLGTTKHTRREHGSAYELNGGSAQQELSKNGHKRISKDPWGDMREDGASDEVQIMHRAELDARSQHADLDFGFAKANSAAVKEIEPL
ncbi:hypothetical protein LTR86_004809 [Recurvomyces mirabilis]|nr:hypothetical protein LTR86_004809 [Recurvomyces mirabilis]